METFIIKSGIWRISRNLLIGNHNTVSLVWFGEEIDISSDEDQIKDFLTMKIEQWWHCYRHVVKRNIFYENVSRSVSFLEEIEIMQL